MPTLVILAPTPSIYSNRNKVLFSDGAVEKGRTFLARQWSGYKVWAYRAH